MAAERPEENSSRSRKIYACRFIARSIFFPVNVYANEDFKPRYEDCSCVVISMSTVVVVALVVDVVVVVVVVVAVVVVAVVIVAVAVVVVFVVVVVAVVVVGFADARKKLYGFKCFTRFVILRCKIL